MKINILAFGVAKEIFGSSEVSLEMTNDATISNLKYLLEQQYPRLKQLSSYMLAVNNEYALPGDTIHERDEIAIIPPVSGGVDQFAVCGGQLADSSSGSKLVGSYRWAVGSTSVQFTVFSWQLVGTLTRYFSTNPLNLT